MNINYSKQDIEKAKSISLIDYLTHKGYNPKHMGKYYKFEINGHTIDINENTPNRWTRWSSGEHGDNIDLLIKMMGCSFQSAISELLGDKYTTIESHQEPQKTPKTVKQINSLLNIDTSKIKRVYAYLIKTRGISPQIVQDLFNNNLVCSDNKGNIIFYHYNITTGEIVGFTKRGTISGARFFYTDDCVGGLSFFILNTWNGNIQPIEDIAKLQIDHLIILESPIDTLSYYELYRNRWSGKRVILISLSSVDRFQNFLKWYKDKGLTSDVLICTDNDIHGYNVLKVAKDNGLSFRAWFGELRASRVKDYNELLQLRKSKK